MSKGKRAKSGSAHDINKWENGLIQAVLNEDVWKMCVFFLVSNKPEDNDLINISSEVISTGLRKLFSVISKEQLYKEVKDFAKAIGSSGGKGKPAVKLPEFVEICEQVKPFIDQGEEIPPSLLAKLLKFKLLLLKTKDFERREEAKKEKVKSASGKKGDKRSESPGKRSKSPKKKTKKGEAERPPSPKKDTKLKRRGEVEDTFKTIDDEPDDEDSPQHYVLIHGFLNASTIQHLANVGVHVNAIIKLQQDEYTSKILANVTEETHEDVEAETEEPKEEILDDDVADQSSKDEEELATFWRESEELVFSAPNGRKLKDIAKYEVTVKNTLPSHLDLADIEAEKKNELGTTIFEKIANTCYDMLDHQKSYRRFLDAMKLLHIPVQTPNVKTDIQPTAAVTTDSPEQVEIDMRYYNHLVNSVPDESMSVPLVLHCLLEQVVATVEETDPLAKQTQVREDGLDNDLAAHINTRMTDLALSAAEKQDILEADGVKKRHETTKVPEILDYSDKLSQRLHYLEDISILDGLDTERAVLDTAAPRALDMFPRRTTAKFMESDARFHQFIQHCSFPSAENVSYLLKKYTFEGMPLKSVEATGSVVEPQELDKKFSSYNIPCDDPYSDFSKYFNARDQGMINDDVDIASVSAAVSLLSFRNLDDWCYVEEFDKTTFTQVLEDARHSHPFVDTYYHKHDDTLLLVYHNPVDKHLHNTSQWTVRLLSNVGFRNYLEHISSMICDWNLQQDRIEEENNKTPTPVPPTPEPPKTEVKTVSRYGLKTRAEIAALKAEEEDKGKKKGKRSARSRTPKSGKKSSAEKKAGQKNRTTSAGSPGRGTKGSKARVAQEVETQPEVDDEGAMDAEELYDFLGYDVGDDLIHVTGIQSSLFPCDGGEIRVQKTQYVRGANSASISVHKDGNILKLHFLEPLEEILPDQASDVVEEFKAETSESREKTDDTVTQDESSTMDEGLEKSEFEANEKTASFHQDLTVENEHIPSEPTIPMFCTHASFVAHLNDGMVITCSGFGPRGIPGKPGGDLNEDSAAGVPLDPSPPPKVSSPKSRKKNEEEAKRLEELRLAEEKQLAEEEARRLKELQESIKKPFHEIFVSCPDGLHVSYRNDENFASAQDSGGVVTRQCYPLKSRGLHECEAIRGKVAMRELSRSVTTDGTVIKIMLDNSIEVLHPDGSTSSCPIFPEKSDKPDERIEPSTQQSSRKPQTNNPPVTLPQDEADDQMETTSELSAQWTTVTADGERLVQNLDGSEKYLEAVKLSVATCPVTHQIYKTREDNVITVIRPDGTQIVEHSDGTRITTYYDAVRIEIRAADAETGEEAEYESRVCEHVKVECEGFATVVMDTENGCSRTLFGNGSNIHTAANGECVVEKSDGSRLCFDIKGNIAYIPRELSSHDCPNLSELNDNCSHRGVYLLRTTSQHCCELLDQRGNVFSAYSNGEIKIDESEENDANMPSNDHNEESLGVDASPSLPNTPHVPRFFVMHRNGTGYELLRHQDVSEFLKKAEEDAATAILKTPVEGLPGVTGITVLKPFPGGVGKTWMKEKDEKILIPVGLRERDFKMFPAEEFKKIGPKFGCNAGSGLNVGNMRKPVAVKPQMTCPRVLVLRHLIKYEPSDSTHRETISAAFQQYGDYVTKLQLQADGCLPRESREAEEVERSNRLTSKYEPMKSNKSQVTGDTSGLCQGYVKSVTPAEQPPPPAPEWKRSPAEWERDRIELAKLDYGKHALRYQEVPPYFETAQGQAFLTGIKAVPDMTKLSADLDKQACPARTLADQQRSGSSTPAETIDQSNATNESRDRNDSKSLDRYSSAVLENLDPEGRHSPGDPPIQSSTPFASRPINPTPAQAAGRPTPTASRPTNPTPRQASNVISSEAIDSPRNVQSILEYTPLEALVETQHEVSTMEDNDTALDMTSSTNSQYNDDNRQKSLYIDVTGSPRKDAVRLPNVILGGKPGALPNTQFSTVEDPVRRKVQTVSAVGKNVSNMRGFELFPAEVDFGVLKEGCTYIHSVMLKNIGIDSCRFKIRQPPPSTGMKVLFTPGPVAAGMNTKLDIEIFAVAVGVSGESGIGSIGHHVEIVGETDIIYLPVTATILTAFEYDNRSSSLPQGYHSPGTQMISNRPPSREAIRPQRDHIYSNVAKHF